MSSSDDVLCRCGAPARVARAVFASDGTTPIMIELMHVHNEDSHRHLGADLDSLMVRLNRLAPSDDDGDY